MTGSMYLCYNTTIALFSYYLSYTAPQARPAVLQTEDRLHCVKPSYIVESQRLGAEQQISSPTYIAQIIEIIDAGNKKIEVVRKLGGVYLR